MAAKKGQEAPETVEEGAVVVEAQEAPEEAPEAPQEPSEGTLPVTRRVDPQSVVLGAIPSEMRDSILIELANEYPDSPVGHSVSLDVHQAG